MVYSYSTGITGLTRKTGGAGCFCHDFSQSVVVNITGPDSVSPSQVLTYTLSITGGPLIRGGTNIAVQRGTIDTIGTEGLWKIGSELTHSVPKVPSGGNVSFQFRYTAPLSPGYDTLYAAGNSVNFNDSNSGDQWNHAAEKIIVVRDPVGIINNSVLTRFKLYQNYPNPFNPNTIINFQLPMFSYVKLIVHDVLGREVVTLVNEELKPGSYEVEWDGTNYTSGVYYYRLSVSDYTQTKKMVLLK